MAPRPDELGGRGIDDPHIHSHSVPIGALSAAGNDVVIFMLRSRRPRELSHCGPLGLQWFEREAAALSKKVGDEVVGKSVHQALPIGIARQIAHRRYCHGNARQQAWPLRFF